ncbi:MAG: metallophosphoesterase family protein [Phycisphaerales bacterium]|nr:metallophosphatase family protein [Phycisphaerae bacterium]NNF41484.1 metallophosphoesterase family protein [Phycisphaerales bacterium]NNM26961.1 metallophosphoesterase family protein [Phycisphaerales bacterium]
MSRYAIISDIHGNLFALQAVLARMSDLDVTEVVCLGDIVGYGPYPGECLDLTVKYSQTIVQGNHDEAVVDPLCADAFNGAAREAIFWTRDVLGPLHLNALNQLPLVASLGPGNEIFCVHDSPHDTPTRYVHDKQIAALAFAGVTTPICLLGHTHMPMVFEAPMADQPLTAPQITAYIPNHEVDIVLRDDCRYICNPGSVGQPRDCDPRASFAVYDTATRTFTVHRVEYDVAAAQAATQQAGLPTILADRLAIGA